MKNPGKMQSICKSNPLDGVFFQSHTNCQSTNMERKVKHTFNYLVVQGEQTQPKFFTPGTVTPMFLRIAHPVYTRDSYAVRNPFT